MFSFKGKEDDAGKSAQLHLRFMKVQKNYKTFGSLLRVREIVISMANCVRLNGRPLGTSSRGSAPKHACL
jgi:hypothetical protein